MYSADQGEGEMASAVWLVGGGNDGIGAHPQTAGQAHLLGIAVRHAARHWLLVQRHICGATVSDLKTWSVTDWLYSHCHCLFMFILQAYIILCMSYILW